MINELPSVTEETKYYNFQNISSILFVEMF